MTNNNILSKDQLTEGTCKVIYKIYNTIKEAQATYSTKLNTVFYCIPSKAEIIGYRQ